MTNVDKLLSHICLSECPYGNCCSSNNGNFILGRVQPDDVSQFLKLLSDKFGKTVTFDEVFLTYDEGKEIFKESDCWQNPHNYPALRIQTELYKQPCVFYNTALKACSVYDIRPKMCRSYGCDYFKERKSQIM